jgi:hypothetical protein
MPIFTRVVSQPPPPGRIEISLATFERRIALALRGIAEKTWTAPGATAIE